MVTSSKNFLFPSPCGVLVLKCSGLLGMDTRVGSFRPLAGFWFLNASKALDSVPVNRVSVPLRGSGS